VGYNRNTSLHLSEHRANYASKVWQTEGCAMLIHRERKWVEYKMLALDSDDFETIGEAFEAVHPIREVLVGAARARLMSQPAIVDFGARWMEEHR
jgi:aminoglycoside 3-N-acetyltransferase